MNEIKRPRIIHYTGEDPETFSIACADALVITESGLIYSNGNPVGGLSKEDISALIEGNHTYSIDFGTDVTTVTDINMFGDITLTEIKGYNATAISYYIQNVSSSTTTLNLVNDVWTGSINIPAKAVVMWTITRAANGNAAAGFKVVKRNGNN